MFIIFMLALTAFISCLILNQLAFALAALAIMALTMVSVRGPDS